MNQKLYIIQILVRKIDYSGKLNELLAQDDDEILIVNDDDNNYNDETIMSESLGRYKCIINDFKNKTYLN